LWRIACIEKEEVLKNFISRELKSICILLNTMHFPSNSGFVGRRITDGPAAAGFVHAAENQ